VALARALVPNPRILLLDEPLSALDARIRRSLRGQIRRIQRETGVTTLFVTHDQEEALEVSDRIFLMNGGTIVQQGSPEEIYARPASEFAARFMGHCNILDSDSGAGKVFPKERESDGGIWGIRPESVLIRRNGQPSPEKARGPFTATVRSGLLLGNVIRYDLDWGGRSLLADELNRGIGLLPEGAAVEVFLEEDALLRLDAKG
jgi:putative spermidine/putrescine transport system ATP-binding protein